MAILFDIQTPLAPLRERLLKATARVLAIAFNPGLTSELPAEVTGHVRQAVASATSDRTAA